MKKNQTKSTTIVALVCLFILFVISDTYANNRDLPHESPPTVIKKKIYPMPRVKAEISPTPAKNLQPEKKSNLPPVSKVSKSKRNPTASVRETEFMQTDTMDSSQHEIPPYSAKGKIDPFIPLIKAPETKKPIATIRPVIDTAPKTDLEKIDLSQLKLSAIIFRDRGGNRGLVQESSGKGHIVALHTKIGTRGGKVVEIRKDRLIIEERGQDNFGRIVAQKRELAFPASPFRK